MRDVETIRAPIAELELEEPVWVEPDDSLRTATEAMAVNSVSIVLVKSEEGVEPAGVLTEWDVVRSVATGKNPEHVWVEDVMSRQLVTVAASDPALFVGLTMLDAGVRHMPIRYGREVDGIASIQDVLRPLVDDALSR